MSVIDVSANATANLGYDDIRHHGPVFHGDTLFAESEVLDTRESNSREHVGIVTTELRAYNRDDEKVLSLEATPRPLAALLVGILAHVVVLLKNLVNAVIGD